ncbi:MAG: protein kinase [Deltaproteobacteria bacterium]|nr:protein kinase [Deltaproteobacteria bacterium]MDQ3296237.1 protein kinase [Myxococcota bacterium]
MNECPELGALEGSPRPPELRDHISRCDSCKLVVEVFDAADGRLDLEDCVQFDALLAARADGTLGRAGRNLLDRHLASCESCREVAATLSPTQDADGDQQALPSVDPASYALGLEVARGGMGRILAARDLRVGRPIAIKELLGRTPQLAARFEREARVTARLQHPGIVPIYEIGKWPDGTPFYSMRMVDGRTLADAISSAKSLAARLALLPAVIAATEAVAFAHAKRVIHRDLTPSNVLVGAYGETVVIDWGLAKDLADTSASDDVDAEAYTSPESSSEQLTGVGAVIGTAAYMPPEQAHAVPVDERADVYALGAILYHLLGGVPPYRAKTARELLRAVKTAPPPPIQEIAPGTPRDLVSIVSKAMARDPDARYPSARELAEELKRFQTGRLVEAHAYSRFELVRRFLRRHRAAVTVSALAFFVLATVGTIAVANILTSRAEARAIVRELILEKGRVELLAGNTQRALAYLYEAYQRGGDGPTLQFLLGSALSGFASSERTLDCGGSVRSVEFDPLGRYVAAGCHDIAKVWRLDNYQEVAKFQAIKLDRAANDFDSVRFSPKHDAIATWGEDGTARIWDLTTGALRATLEHGAHITRLTFTPDGARVATTGYDGIAIIWDVAAQRPHRRIVASEDVFRNLYGLLTPDGKMLLTATLEGKGKGWDVETGKPFGERDHGSFVIGGDVSPDGALAVTCGKDHRTKLWDARTGELVHTLAGHTDAVWKCVFSPDGTLLLTTGHDGTGNVWSVRTGGLLTSVHHGDIVINAHFAPPVARMFVTVGVGGRLKVWDTRSGALLASLDSVRGKDARFSSDGQRLAAARGDGRIQIWRGVGQQQAALRLPPGAAVGAISRDGSRVVLETRIGPDLALSIAQTSTAAAVLHPGTGQLLAPYALATDTDVLVAWSDGGLEAVDVMTGHHLGRLLVGDRVEAVQIATNGARIGVTFPDRCEIWDLATRSRIAILAGARNVMLSDDGRRAITWGEAGVPATVWNVDGQLPIRKVTAIGNFRPIGFAAGGTRVALVEQLESDIHTVSLWSVDSGALLGRRRDTGRAPSIDPSGTWLTTIDTDHSVTVWRTSNGKVHASFLGEPVVQARVNRDGSLVAAVAEYGTAITVSSAVDGRLLARWPIEHEAPAVSQETLQVASSRVAWSRDGASLISVGVGVNVWSVARKYKPAEIAQLVKRNVPWRVENGHLAWIRNSRLHGTVIEDGKPRPGVKILVEIRTPPDVGATPINWESSKIRVSTRNITTNALGEFALDGLVPGEYVLTVHERPFTAHVSAEDDPVVIDLTADP